MKPTKPTKPTVPAPVFPRGSRLYSLAHFYADKRFDHEAQQLLWNAVVLSALRSGTGQPPDYFGPVVLGDIELLVPLICDSIDIGNDEAGGTMSSPHLQDIEGLIGCCIAAGFKPTAQTTLDTYRVAAYRAGLGVRDDKITGTNDERYAAAKSQIGSWSQSPRAYQLVARSLHTLQYLSALAPRSPAAKNAAP